MSDTKKSGGLKPEFKVAGREVTQHPPEKPFLTELDKHEASRALLTKNLDAQVLSGKIDKHEMRYQLGSFENDLSGNFRKQNPQLFEDKEKAQSQANSQEKPSQTKGQGDRRTLTFFEDRNKTDINRGR